MIAAVAVPAIRIRSANDAPIRPDGEFVLYWMIAARRPRWNHALDRAVELARELGRPLLVLEPLRSDYPWASDRFHRFVLSGMRDNAAAFGRAGVTYHPYVEPEKGAGRGLLSAFAERASAVVTDDFPGFFLPRMVAAAAGRLPVRLEAVDGNGLLPLRATSRSFDRAVDFRRFLQKTLPDHLGERPRADPFAGRLPGKALLPPGLVRRWPAADPALLAGGPLSSLPIDHAVTPAPLEGGARAAGAALARFVSERLASYAELRNEPSHDVTSGLSPYLHFGHVSSHQVLASLARHEGWTSARLSGRPDGKKEGWWGMSAPAEAFLDQLVTWRELGLNTAHLRDDGDRYESLPWWARATLEAHRSDPRPHVYTLEALERAATHDEVWNAAQRQLLTEGRIHNYLRMLWGKSLLRWSATPQEAVRTLVVLNDRWALDGRDPNSISGIFWTFGRYDRPWPEREVFGTVRSMTSESARRKLDLGPYLARFSEQASLPIA